MNLHDPATKLTSADEALQLLKEGNERFTKGELSAKDDYAGIRDVLAGGQQPFAIVLCCADSRVAPEIYFDQKLGDIFVIRNAGNVVDKVVLGSVEYGAEHLGSPLVVVVGHTSCGAVTAACTGGEVPENIGEIITKIKPSVSDGAAVNDVARVNAKAMADQIRADEIIKHLGTRVEAAIYDIKTGEVSWL
ncbi:MAG: carbonic anhydrase [Lachnospiraceae bacterium]|nr:carbonic anhydrase [Lachnospiraceae bacterium]